MKSRMWTIFLLALALVLAGCVTKEVFVCSDGSKVADPATCPVQKEVEVVPDIKEPVREPVPEGPDYKLSPGESVMVNGKAVKLISINNAGKAVVSVGGYEMEFPSTKHMEIVKDLEIKTLKFKYEVTDPSKSVVDVNIVPYVAGTNHYLMHVDDVQTVGGIAVKLKQVDSSDHDVFIDINAEIFNERVREGFSVTLKGVTIENIRTFPHGLRTVDYAILKITAEE